MESISGHYAYKTSSPEEYIDQKEVDFIEANLSHCPFCYWKPFFEESKDGWFVACQCGARMPGDDAQDAAAKWNTRPVPIARKVLREGPRACWPGA